MNAAPTKELLSFFDECHRATVHAPAVFSRPKDPQLLAGLWRSHPDQVRPLIARFFAERNEFVERAGFSVGVFRSQFARLLVQWQKDQRRLAQAEEDPYAWYQDCKRLHNGECNGRYAHSLRMPPKE